MNVGFFLSRLLLVLAVAGIGFGVGGLYAWSFSRHTTLVQGGHEVRGVREVRPATQDADAGAAHGAGSRSRSFHAPSESRREPPTLPQEELDANWDGPLGSHF